MKELSDQQLMRYSRHIMLKDMDIDGQELLYNSKVLIIGVGGLGCAAAQYIVASGIGEVTLVDDDIVEHSNLQRQVLHTESHIGLNKCISAKNSLYNINSEVTINVIENRLSGEALAKEIASHDIVVDCCDNLTTRNEINQACYTAKKPLVSGAAIRMEGQVSVFTMEENTPCYHCLSQTFGEQSLTCMEAGVLSPLVGMVGSLQACETIKLITHIGQCLTGKLLLIDAKTMSINTFNIAKANNCAVCG